MLRALDHLSGSGADLVLMNLQYAPAVLDQLEAPTTASREMLQIIEMIAAENDIAHFRRFEIMRHWRVDRGIPFDQMISNFDGNWLHQNDWSYDCIAKALCPPAPAKQLLRRQSMAPSHGTNRVSARDNLGNNARFVLVAPPPPATGPGEDFQPAYRLGDSIMLCVHSKPNG
jgi:hypothetical protein